MKKFRFQEKYIDAYIFVRGIQAIFEAVPSLNADGHKATLENIQNNTRDNDGGTIMIILHYAEKDGYLKKEKGYKITPDGRMLWDAIIRSESNGF